MATYYVDPSIETAGNGLSEATAFKYYGSVPNAPSNTILFRADGLLHRPSAAIPTNLTSANFGRDMSANSAGVTYGAYGTGNPIITGAVAWTDAAGDVALNGLPCKTLATSTAVSPFWFPRSSRRATYPAICAATDSDEIDTFAVNPAAFDDISKGVPGVRFTPASRYGGTTDPTKEVSYVYTPTEALGDQEYRIKIRAPGFWARAHAVQSIIGCNVITRQGANFTNYLCTIDTYDEADGSVTLLAFGRPNGGENGAFFWALIAHPYGLRVNRQYAMLPGNFGWVANLPAGDIDVACYSTAIRCMSDNQTFDVSKVWTFEALSHGNSGVNAGCGIFFDQGVTNATVGDVIARQIRNVDRNGAPVRCAGAGVMSNITVGAISQYECMGIKAFEIAPSAAVGGNSHVAGPVYSSEGGGGIRIAGGGENYSISDVVITPRASIHDNAANVYQEAMDTLLDGIVIVGATNPYAAQFNKYTIGSPTTSVNMRRKVKNAWFSGRPKIDQSGYDTSWIMRHDNGNSNGLYDRIVTVNGGGNTIGNGYPPPLDPNNGMVWQRSVIEGFVATDASLPLDGVTFKYCVFPYKSLSNLQATTIANIEAFGGTCENCVELPDKFNGTLTDDMWRVLTINDTFDGYEAVPWLAPQLGLTLPAYGSARTLVAPAFVRVPFRVGHQPGVMYGTFINPNPLATMTLPVGAGDNDKLAPTLFGGVNVIPSVACPDQTTFEIVLRVADAGAVNGPYQDFTYSIPVDTFSDGIVYGPFTLSVADALGTTKALPDFLITVAA